MNRANAPDHDPHGFARLFDDDDGIPDIPPEVVAELRALQRRASSQASSQTNISLPKASLRSSASSKYLPLTQPPPPPSHRGGKRDSHQKIQYKKRSYTLRTGERGGHYILVNGEKKYIRQP